ncbi:MAG TPA: glycosyltransferase family 4 protein [Syntrophales bacterium]|jgi:glycosyltransferase involved in cell wall biosynthesis|nr:glycosyltransferase family 4 protein [Syntrophales bacterium]HRT61923.1 glycosyltransferase family 4 protein [Syntrophales bacterium]
MRVLMLGWEFPPHISGGLGTACFGLTRALVNRDVEVLFVLPSFRGERQESHVRLLAADEVPVPTGYFEGGIFFKGLDVRLVDAMLRPYMTGGEYESLFRRYAEKKEDRGYLELTGEYGTDLLSEVMRYAAASSVLAATETFDVIHAHDWMSVFAAVQIRRASGRPMVFHVHSLEYDRSGESIDRQVYDIERLGMEEADHVISVSAYTKERMTARYGIDAGKITVVHNAVSRGEAAERYHVVKPVGEKTVLFLGRVTFQKGPEYFLAAAEKLIKAIPGIRFVMAGSGDLLPRLMERAETMGISERFHFTGFLRGEEVERMYAASDLYVMPSVSEPFGISPLEALLYDVPVIISKQSGVGEILRHALKVDFWDVEELANKIHAVLAYGGLSAELLERCREEMIEVTWENAATRTLEVYRKVLR